MQSNNTYYSLPRFVLDIYEEIVKNYNGNKKEKGYVVAKNALDQKKLSFRNLKKIKHEYENSGGTTKTLLGGQKVYNWIISTLEQKSRTEKFRRKGKERAGLDNAYRKAHTKKPSAKPSFLNNSYKIIVNESVLKEFKLTKQIGGGAEGDVFETGKYVIKRYRDVNPVRKENLMKKINVFFNVNHQNIITPLDLKVNDNIIEVYYKKLLPIKNTRVKWKLGAIWHDEYYNNNRQWDLKTTYKKIDELPKIDKHGHPAFSDELKKKMKGIIAAHDILSTELKKSGYSLPADTFFPSTGDNVMQDSNGTWKIIDF